MQDTPSTTLDDSSTDVMRLVNDVDDDVDGDPAGRV
jgi:hypothetical protein